MDEQELAGRSKDIPARQKRMIAAIGLMIGLYILARYCEMSRTATTGEKVLFIVFSIVTMLCIADLLLTAARVGVRPDSRKERTRE